MVYRPILLPESCVDIQIQPLPPAVRDGAGVFVQMNTSMLQTLEDFARSNITAITDADTRTGLRIHPHEELKLHTGLALICYDGIPYAQPSLVRRQGGQRNQTTAVLLRDAIGFLDKADAPVGDLDPAHLALPPLPDGDTWWPFVWLRPITSSHQILDALPRVQADLDAFAPGILPAPIIGRRV